MDDGYAIESGRLDALAKVMALVTEEFEVSKDADLAVTGYVLCAMIRKQIGVVDKQLDILLK